MIRPQATPPPAFRSPDLAGAEQHARQDPAQDGVLDDDPAIADFIKRLNCAIDDIARKK